MKPCKDDAEMFCRPEFSSGPYQFGVGLSVGKMLKQVQHDN